MQRPRPNLPDRTPPFAAGRRQAVLFDWGDTVMRVFAEAVGPMAEWERVEAVPGVRRALVALRPHTVLGLATNAADSDVAQIRTALRRVRLSSCFERIYCFRALGVRKPTRAYFAAVLADLGLPPHRVVMVGDDWEADVEGALAAGLRAVWYDPLGGCEEIARKPKAALGLLAPTGPGLGLGPGPGSWIQHVLKAKSNRMRHFGGDLGDDARRAGAVVQDQDQVQLQVQVENAAGRIGGRPRAVCSQPHRRGGSSHERVRVLHDMGRLPELLAKWGMP